LGQSFLLIEGSFSVSRAADASEPGSAESRWGAIGSWLTKRASKAAGYVVYGLLELPQLSSLPSGAGVMYQSWNGSAILHCQWTIAPPLKACWALASRHVPAPWF
jgi:hypothetical protein